MKGNSKKYLIIFVLFFLLGIFNVRADSNIIDLSKKGSIVIDILTNDNEPIIGAEISIYKVADAKIVNNNLLFENIDEINSCEIDFTKIGDEAVSNELVNCIISTDISKKTLITNNSGRVKFDSLELGLYLVVQNNMVKGYSKIDSYLVMIPYEVDNKWCYDSYSVPKTDIFKTMDITVLKEWNKQNEFSKLPDSVTIQLLKENVVISTVLLNDENNWTYTWFDLEKSDEYDVKEIDIPDGYTASYRNDGDNFIVTNTDKLPQTGQLVWPIPFLLITGLSCIIVGIYNYRRESNEK